MLEQNVEIYEQIRQARRARDARLQAAEMQAAAQVFPEEKPGLPKWVVPAGLGVAAITAIMLLK